MHPLRCCYSASSLWRLIILGLHQMTNQSISLVIIVGCPMIFGSPRVSHDFRTASNLTLWAWGESSGSRGASSEAQYQMREAGISGRNVLRFIGWGLAKVKPVFSQAKRKREAAQFFTYQARLLRHSGASRDRGAFDPQTMTFKEVLVTCRCLQDWHSSQGRPVLAP